MNRLRERLERLEKGRGIGDEPCFFHVMPDLEPNASQFAKCGEHVFVRGESETFRTFKDRIHEALLPEFQPLTQGGFVIIHQPA